MQAPFDDPEFDTKLKREAEEKTPRNYPWPNTDEETFAAYIGLAAFGIAAVFCTFAGLEIDSFGLAGIGTAVGAAAIAYLWRKHDLKTWQDSADREYWRLKAEKKQIEARTRKLDKDMLP